MNQYACHYCRQSSDPGWTRPSVPGLARAERPVRHRKHDHQGARIAEPNGGSLRERAQHRQSYADLG